MEKKMDAMFEMVERLTIEVTALRSEVNEFKVEMHHRLDKVDERFNTLDLKLDNLTAESRNCYKRLEDKTADYQLVLGKLPFEANVHDVRIDKIEEKLK